MNISFQSQQQNNPVIQNLTQPVASQQSAATSILPSNTNEPKTVFDSLFNLGQKLATGGKAKFNDYAEVAFSLAKNYLSESSWLKNSSSVLARATNTALQANSWKEGLKDAGKVALDWGKNLLKGWF